MRFRLVPLAVAVLAGLLSFTPAPAAAPPTMFPGCAAQGSAVVVGHVACQLLHSPMLGGTTAFSYYVPPACAPVLHRRCPTLYLLHGFGGDATEMVGTADRPSAWVAAETKAPPGTAWEQRPWNHADPAGWVPRPALDM